jgi:hypothetical protein
MNEEVKQQILDQFTLLFGIMMDDKFTDMVAEFSWKMFTKLKEKGFTEEQAIRITAGMAKQK